MRWNWKLGTFAGIAVYVHWTFALLILFVGYVHFAPEQDLGAALRGVGLMLSLFACVLLHEFGHALTAKRFNIKTRDITLYPIGGLARLERMPDNPLQELWVAIAGPLVNVAIALVLLGVIIVGDISIETASTIDQVPQVPFVVQLLAANIILAVFNMLPAFPMDGGRVLRALLATKMNYVRATQIAANIGQAMAIMFGIFAMFTSHFFLLFIAIFVYLGAAEEAQSVQMRSMFRNIPVHDAMIRRFQALKMNDPVGKACDELLIGEQQDFPVLDDGKLAGVLTRRDMVKALSEGGREVPVGEVMRRDCTVVTEGDMVDAVFQRMRDGSCPIVPVVRNGELVGMVSLENIGELLMIQSALDDWRSRHNVHNIYRP